MSAEHDANVALLVAGLGATVISDTGTETMQEVGPEPPFDAADGATAPDPFAVTIDERLRADISRAIIDYSRNLPRNLQTELGPSDVGHPCLRNLAHGLLATAHVSQGGDVLPSLVGTWAHTGLDKVFGDPKHGGRWIVNRELVAWDGPGGKGHGDAYDTLTRCVIDWKFKGTEAMREARKGNVGEQYEVQLDVYGLGWENAGYQVDYVADAFFSRGGNLEGRYGLHMYVRPYDRARALAAKERLGHLIAAAHMLQLDTVPAHWAEIPATPVDCHFCPWLRLGETDLSVACPGDSATTTKENAA